VRGIKGKVAIVTGGSRGMGGAAVRRLVEEGATVVIGDILEAEGTSLAKELADACTFMRLDVSDEQNWEDVVAAVVEQHGTIDILINNAGILQFAMTHKLEREVLQKLIDVNQIGVALGMKHVSRVMAKQGGGAIVNVSSVEGFGAAPGTLPYAATKFAVRGMTKAAAWDLGRKNIRVNSVHPGAIRTDMIAEAGGGGEESEAWMASRNALKVMGMPEQVAAVMVFLASDDASFMTGAEVAVDGGASSTSGFSA